jgi:hypothetical protein
VRHDGIEPRKGERVTADRRPDASGPKGGAEHTLDLGDDGNPQCVLPAETDSSTRPAGPNGGQDDSPFDPSLKPAYWDANSPRDGLDLEQALAFHHA